MAKGGSRAAKTDYLRFLNHLTPEDIEVSRKSGPLQKFLEEFIGTENVVAMIGLKKLIQQIGPEKLIQQIGVDGLLAKMSPAQRRELKRQLQEQS